MMRVVGIGAALCFLSVCVATAAPTPPSAARDAAARDLSFTVALDQLSSALPAQGSSGTVHGVATLTNTSGQPVKFMYGGRTVIWQVVDAGGTVIYDDSIGRSAPMFVMIRVLDPGKSLTFPREVPLTHQDGSPLGQGSYVLRVTMNGLHLVAHAGFTVVGSSRAMGGVHHRRIATH